jgi:hypothetical protein
LHCFVWADFNMHARLARSPNSSYDRWLAARYGGSRDKYFCTRVSAPYDQTGSCNSYDGADKLCEHGNRPLQLGMGHGLRSLLQKKSIAIDVAMTTAMMTAPTTAGMRISSRDSPKL